MTPWFASFKTGTCATRWFRVRVTLAHRVTTLLLPHVTPSAAWRSWPWRWFATSTKKPSIFKTTTTAAPKSQPFFQAAFRTCWLTDRSVSPLVWPPTFHRRTFAKLPKVLSGRWLTQMRHAKSCKKHSSPASRAQTFQLAQPFSAAAELKTLTAPAVARSRCAQSSTSKSFTTAPAW